MKRPSLAALAIAAVPVARRISRPHATGLTERDRDGFISVFKAFLAPESLTPTDSTNDTYMPWSSYAAMSEDDLGAIYDYLQTVEPIENQVDKRPRRAAAREG